MSTIRTNILVFTGNSTFDLKNARAISVVNAGETDVKIGPEGTAEIPVKAEQTFSHDLGAGDRHEDTTWEVVFPEEGGRVIILTGIIIQEGNIDQQIAQIIERIKV